MMHYFLRTNGYTSKLDVLTTKLNILARFAHYGASLLFITNIMNLHSQLDHYLTQWDIKQSTKRGYNPFALGIYLERAEDLAKDVAQGATISDAIDVHFCDRIAAMLHKKFS